MTARARNSSNKRLQPLYLKQAEVRLRDNRCAAATAQAYNNIAAPRVFGSGRMSAKLAVLIPQLYGEGISGPA